MDSALMFLFPQSSYLAATLDQPLKKQKQKRREESLRLLLLVNGAGSVFHAVLSFIGLHLFDFSDETNSGKTADQTVQLEKIRFPLGVDGNIFAMGFCVLGSELYLVGGQKSEKESDSEDGVEDKDLLRCENPEKQTYDSATEGEDYAPFPAYSRSDYSRSVFVVKFEDSQPSEVWELPEMESGKACPLVVEVEKTLYVLPGLPVQMLPDPAFEAYNIIQKEWEELESPPFLQSYSKSYSKYCDPRLCSFVVIKKTIHVSTPRSSYSYDTEGREWSRCALFDDAPPELRGPWVEVICSSPNSVSFKPLKRNEDEEQVCGLPFNFDGGAVLYGEDVLIGVVRSEGVVAYKLVDGKVKYYKFLEDLEIPRDSPWAYLADFKEGNLCLVFFLEPYQASLVGKPAISIKPFQVFKPRYEKRPKDENTEILNWSDDDDDDHDKLNDKNWIYYKVGKTISPEIPLQLANKCWIPLGCFAL